MVAVFREEDFQNITAIGVAKPRIHKGYRSVFYVSEREKREMRRAVVSKESFSAGGKIFKTILPLLYKTACLLTSPLYSRWEERIVEQQNSGFVVFKRLAALM